LTKEEENYISVVVGIFDSELNPREKKEGESEER